MKKIRGDAKVPKLSMNEEEEFDVSQKISRKKKVITQEIEEDFKPKPKLAKKPQVREGSIEAIPVVNVDSGDDEGMTVEG